MSTDERKQDAGSGRVAGRAGPPWAVRAAVALLWVNAGLNALDLVLVTTGVTPGDGSSTATNLVALAVGVVVAALLSVLLWRGVRWARWAAGVYLALGVVVNVWGSLSGPALPDLLIYLASALVLFVAAGFLFNDEETTRYFARG